MKIYEYSLSKKEPTAYRLIALGFFDGVHEGHRHLLKTAKSLARKKGLVFSVFTFKAECEALKSSSRLYQTEEKLELLEKLEADEVILADFNELSSVSAENFIKKVLIDGLSCSVAVSGRDFRFGNGAAGDINLLKKMLSENGADAYIVEDKMSGGEKISTTRIKKLLSEGKVEDANRLLGSPYFIRTTVESGLGKGKSLGFPTVNSSLDEKNFPLKRGVYRTAVRVGDKTYPSITNIGVCPTFEERSIHAETNIIDFDGNLYGEKIYITFYEYLREEIRFNNEKELISQIKVDINKIKTRNGDI